MEQLTLAIVAIFLVVGVAMAAVLAIAYYGYRAAFTPPSPRAMRRLAYSMGGFGFFGLGYTVAIALYGPGIQWLILIQSVGLLAVAIGQLRDPRVRSGQANWDEPRSL